MSIMQSNIGRVAGLVIAIAAFASSSFGGVGQIGYTVDGRPLEATLVEYEGDLYLVDGNRRVLAQLRPQRVSKLVLNSRSSSAAVAEDRKTRAARLVALGKDLARRDVDPRQKFIGVNLETPSPALAAQLGINRSRSAVITRVTRGGTAGPAGLRAYDVIVGINGHSRGDLETLRRRTRATGVGDTVHLEIIREGRRLRIDVPVGLRQSQNTH